MARRHEDAGQRDLVLPVRRHAAVALPRVKVGPFPSPGRGQQLRTLNPPPATEKPRAHEVALGLVEVRRHLDVPSQIQIRLARLALVAPYRRRPAAPAHHPAGAHLALAAPSARGGEPGRQQWRHRRRVGVRAVAQPPTRLRRHAAPQFPRRTGSQRWVRDGRERREVITRTLDIVHPVGGHARGEGGGEEGLFLGVVRDAGVRRRERGRALRSIAIVGGHVAEVGGCTRGSGLVHGWGWRGRHAAGA
ncbi:hypothetical protein C8R46DRAFT_1145039 [Mycena filopes]|nr:hypothetical protein C8R46DRAFT_1145039 [Mycena filopes]